MAGGSYTSGRLNAALRVEWDIPDREDRDLRLAQGLRQDQLAAAAGVGPRFLVELERGKPTVRLAMSREFQTAEAHDLLDVAFQRLQGCQCHVLPVLQGGHVVGLLTPENVGEFIMFRGVVGAPLPAASAS